MGQLLCPAWSPCRAPVYLPRALPTMLGKGLMTGDAVCQNDVLHEDFEIVFIHKHKQKSLMLCSKQHA